MNMCRFRVCKVSSVRVNIMVSQLVLRAKLSTSFGISPWWPQVVVSARLIISSDICLEMD